MAQGTVRFLWQNYFTLTGTLFTLSSENLSFPRRWLLDPLRSMRARTKTGWTVVLGVNDTIDVTGVGTAVVAPGYYATGAALAAAVQTALLALSANAWLCTYDAVTHKFTISGTAAFVLQFGTGATLYKTLGIGLGWTAADTGSATTQTSPQAVYQSQAFLVVDLASALEVKSVVLVGMQTLTALGTVKIQGNATNVWTAPTYNQTVGPAAQTEDIIVHHLTAPTTLRYWRIVVSDPYQSAGFVEMALPYIGSYLSILGAKSGFDNTPEALSLVQISDLGGIFADNKGDADALRIFVPALLRNEKLAVAAMYKAIGARPLLFILDPERSPLDVRYMSMMDAPTFTHQEAMEERYNANFNLREQVL